ncbi:MAG: hypothetical protein J6T08_02570 [Lentisphaeria bacterium]|nr:hypothetical protein [Lentisphaeria bacterium]
MDKAQFTERLQAIGTEEDEAQRRELIAQLIEEGGNDYDDHAAAVAARDQALTDNEELRQANMRLFLRVGEKKEPDINPNQQPPEKRNYKNLFDEKGGIK